MYISKPNCKFNGVVLTDRLLLNINLCKEQQLIELNIAVHDGHLNMSIVTEYRLVNTMYRDH